MAKTNPSLKEGVPFGRKNRQAHETGYVRNSSSKGYTHEGVIPANDKYPDPFIAYAKSLEDARAAVLAELATREGILVDVRPSRHDNQDFFQMLVLRKGAGLNDRLIDIFKRGLVGLGHSKIGWGRFLVKAFSKVQDAKRVNPERRKNTQKENMRPSLRRLIQWGKWTTPANEVIQNPQKLEKVIHDKLIKETPGGPALSTRSKDKMNAKRLVGLGCEIHDIPKPKSWVFAGKPEGVRPPTECPNPEIVNTLRHRLLSKPPEFRLFALFQSERGLRPEEAHRALRNPLQFFADDHCGFPQDLSKTGTQFDRVSQIRPNSWAWYGTIPGFLTGERTDFRLVRHGKFVTCNKMQDELYALLKECGYVPPPGGTPDECLRKAMLSAAIACCDGPHEHHLIAFEAGHAVLRTLYKHYDVRWTRAMGIAYWSCFPGAIPEGLSDYEIYRAWGQQPSIKYPESNHYAKHTTQPAPYLLPPSKSEHGGSPSTKPNPRRRKAA